MASSLIQLVASSLINAIFGKGVMRAAKGQESWSLLTPLLYKALTERGHKMDHVNKIF